MQTPIADFVRDYAEKKGSRFHMPGHKGQAFLGCEKFDITEIMGADALYEAEGIIAESEQKAAELFGTARTCFSAEGSSQCIRAMLKLIAGYNVENRNKEIPYYESASYYNAERNKEKVVLKEKMCSYIIAARNVHKAFLYAAALVDFDVVWLYPEEMHSLCSCRISEEQVEAELKRQIFERGAAPAAVYVTSPDYLGGQLDIAALAEVCHRYDTILAVDNAHGAYLHFLEEKKHPMDLGADICCDSAHKTLPVLTGGAYLQISKNAPAYFSENAKQAMVLFGSTSPSYLIMASLDLCNAYLEKDYKRRLTETVQRLVQIRTDLRASGWMIEQTDPLKLTVQVPLGMTGMELADRLRKAQIECEYADEKYLVLMATPENTEEDFEKLTEAMSEIVRFQSEEKNVQLQPVHCEQRMSIREAIFAQQEQIKAVNSLGRICGVPTVGCPPAIPIVVPGEVINEEAVKLFAYYGVETVAVTKY